MDSRKKFSLFPSSESDSERKSTFIRARDGIEFTDVPPSISPILKLVLGDSGTRAATKRAIPRPSAWMGFGTPKSDQLWPPGPVTAISTLREASAAVVTYSVADPSSAITHFMRFLY